MRTAILAGLILGASALVLAQPSSTATVSPPPNPYGWHNSPVTVTLTATGGLNLVVKYRIGGGPIITSPPPVLFTLSAEGVHTVEHWAEDTSGVEPRKFLTVRIDRTSPAVLVRTPERNRKYILHERATVDWWAFDRLSGIEDLNAAAHPGEGLDTTSPGHQTFWVLARDRAGNTTRLEVDYQVVFLIGTAFGTGFYLDRLLPPEERVQVGTLPVLARYRRGEDVGIAFHLRDAVGVPYPRAGANVVVTEVRFTEEGERHTIWEWLRIPFDPERGHYFLSYRTEGRKPGIYDLWLGFGDGQSARIRIELLPPE